MASTKEIERSTAGLREALFQELERLMEGKISAQRAAVTAKLVTAAIQTATLELSQARHFAHRPNGANGAPAITFATRV